MVVTSRLELDLTTPGLPGVVEAVQGDSGRAVQLTLMENGKPWTPPEGVAVMVRYRNRDGSGGVFDTLPDGAPAYTLQDNTLTLRFPPEALGVPGETLVQAVLTLGQRQVSTFCFQVLTQQAYQGTGGEYVNLSQWLESSAMAQLQQYIDTQLGVIADGAY